MDNFKDDFEYRRNIFGLSSIIKNPEQTMPQLVSQKLPEVMKQLAILCQKMHNDRLKTMKENEEFINKGGYSSDEDSSWGDDDEEDGMQMGADQANADGQQNKAGESSDDEEDKEWLQQKQIFSTLGPKLQTGAPLTQEEMDLAKLDDDDDDDSDYEYQCGDASLYDSGFDHVDEIKFLKDSLIHVNQQNAQYYANLLSLVDQ